MFKKFLLVTAVFMSYNVVLADEHPALQQYVAALELQEQNSKMMQDAQKPKKSMWAKENIFSTAGLFYSFFSQLAIDQNWIGKSLAKKILWSQGVLTGLVLIKLYVDEGNKKKSQQPVMHSVVENIVNASACGK